MNIRHSDKKEPGEYETSAVSYRRLIDIEVLPRRPSF